MIYISYLNDGNIETKAFNSYKHFSTFCQVNCVSPTKAYNTGRKVTDKRHAKPLAPMFIQRISAKEFKANNMLPTGAPQCEDEMLYSRASAICESRGDDRCCAVIAIMVGCNVGYDTAASALAKHGRKFGRGSYPRAIKAAFSDLGYSLNYVDGLNNGTMSTIHRRLPSAKTFVAYVRGHIAAIKNGEVQDWTAGRRHQVQYVYEVVKAA